MRILRITGNGFSAPTDLKPDAMRCVQIPSLRLGDANQDGDLDIVYGYAPYTGLPGSSALGLGRNDGSLSFRAVQSTATGYALGGLSTLQIVDVNGVQVNDIIGRAAEALVVVASARARRRELRVAADLRLRRRVTLGCTRLGRSVRSFSLPAVNNVAPSAISCATSADQAAVAAAGDATSATLIAALLAASRPCA